MIDIYLGFAGMFILGLAGFHAARRMASGWSRWMSNVAALLTVLLLLAYIRWWWNDPRLTLLLPYSNLIVIGNWFLPLIGVLAGLTWARLARRNPRRWGALLLLFGVGSYSTLSPVLGHSPTCTNQWEGDRCLQTTGSTCSPAAAATLLRRYGIDTSEQEMAELCLTREGTTWMGLYRGLKLKTEGTPWDVEIIDLASAANGRLPHGPLILCAMLEPGTPWAEDYEKEWGWIPGVPHSVVFLQRTPDGLYLMADPFAGVETWTQQDVDVLWHGQGIRLVGRRFDDSASPLDRITALAFGD